MATIPPSVLIVRLDAVGDALTTVPLVAALRRHGMRIGAVLRPVNADVFSSRGVDRVHVARNGNIVEEIRAENYDYALIPTEKPLAYQIAKAAKIPRRVGFENGWGKPLKSLWIRRMCTETIFRTAGLDPAAPHECEVVFKLVRHIIPDPEPPRDPAVLRPFVLEGEPIPDERIAIQITDKWERLGAGTGEIVEIVDRIAQAHTVRLIGASHERAYCERIAEAAKLPVETFDELNGWKNSIAAARALVAPDSGAVHVAGMIGTRVVACFAARDFALQTARWSPWAAAHRIIKMEGESWPIVAADALESLLTGNRSAVYRG